MLRTNLMWKFMQTLLELKYINSLLGGGGETIIMFTTSLRHFQLFHLRNYVCYLCILKKKGLGKDRINFLQ